MKPSDSSPLTVQESAAALSLRQLIAQLIMVEIEGTAADDEMRSRYGEHPWGGVILFGKNMEEEQQLLALTGELRQISLSAPPHLPMFIGVDHEGGIVTRFSYPSTMPLCGNMALGAAGNPDYACICSMLCAHDLRRLGINTNFAPVLDVNNNPSNPIIGARSFGESPALVRELGRAYIRGLKEAGVAAAAKHFPGHGDTSFDSHASLATIPHSMDRLRQVELLPFQGAIEEEVDMIMTAHITFPALEPRPGLPATLSKRILTGLLRETMGYKGIIITDSMAMHAITKNFGYEEAAIMALEAGADMVMLCGTFAQQKSALDAVEAAVKEGRLSEERLKESLMRLLARRKGFAECRETDDLRHSSTYRRLCALTAALHPCGEEAEEMREAMRAITLSSITLVRNDDGVLPLRKDSLNRVMLIMPSLFPTSPLGEARILPTLHHHLRKRLPGMEVIEYEAKTGAHDGRHLKERLRAVDLVIFAAFCNGRLPAGQRAILDEVHGASRSVVMVSLNSPYVLLDAPEVKACVYAYNYGDLSMESLAAVLFGEKKPEGKLPVAIPGLYDAGHSLRYES